MKTITTKDEEGYICTRTEPTWESCTEDETEPSKPAAAVAKPPASAPLQPQPQGGKKAKTTGQGNIMSFFQKK